jgi:hypothetical protein
MRVSGGKRQVPGRFLFFKGKRAMSHVDESADHRVIGQRIEGLHKILMAGYDAGQAMSSSVKGTERELFINLFLNAVFPPGMRFSSGDITDIDENHSGQVDIVAESPYLFSFPAVIGGPRLFLAEGVVAAIEVKSDLRKQWSPQIEEKAAKIKKLRRTSRKQSLEEEANDLDRDKQNSFAAMLAAENRAEAAKAPDVPPKVPMFVIGFNGWNSPEDIRTRMEDTDVDAVFVLRHMIYSGRIGQAHGTSAYLCFLQDLSSLLLESSSSEFDTTYHYSFMMHQRRMSRGLRVDDDEIKRG